MAIAYGGPGFGYAPAPPKKPVIRTTNTATRPTTSQAVRPQVKPTVATQQPSSAPAQPVNSVYGSYLQGFGGAEGYAKAISDKTASGGTFSNPAAARQFMTDRSDLFQGANQPKTISTSLFPEYQGDDTGGNGDVSGDKSFMDWLTDLMNKVNESVNAPAATYTPTPVTGMSWDQAQAQAGQRLDPMFSQERRNLGQTTQQQRELLTQMMNARGQLRGGGIVQGNVDLAGELLEALADIGSRRATGVADLATSLQDKDADRARQQEESNFNIWKANQEQNQSKISNLMELLGVAQGQSQFDQTFGEGQRQFNATNALSWAQFNRPYSELTVGEKAEIDLRQQQLNENMRSNKVGESISRGNLGVSQGNLGVSQGNLKLGQDKFAYDQTQDAKGDPVQDAVNTIKADLAQMKPFDAYNELTEFASDYIRDIGIDEYNNLLRSYKAASGQ